MFIWHCQTTYVPHAVLLHSIYRSILRKKLVQMRWFLGFRVILTKGLQVNQLFFFKYYVEKLKFHSQKITSRSVLHVEFFFSVKARQLAFHFSFAIGCQHWQLVHTDLASHVLRRYESYDLFLLWSKFIHKKSHTRLVITRNIWQVHH